MTEMPTIDSPLEAAIRQAITQTIANLTNAQTKFVLHSAPNGWDLQVRLHDHKRNHPLRVRVQPPWEGSANLRIALGSPTTSRTLTPNSNLGDLQQWVQEHTQQFILSLATSCDCSPPYQSPISPLV